MAKGPNHPIYIVSKGRADSRKTVLALDRLGVPYRVIIEAQEWPQYSAVIPKDRLLVLDPAYQRQYDTFDDLGDTKSRGPGPARNFAWDHSVQLGYDWHWVMDDNLVQFYRFHLNRRIRLLDGSFILAMEDFAKRYKNVAMAGPNYYMFVPNGWKRPPFITNTRIYSCNFIRNDTPFRWRGRYNEDTDLSLRMLKAGWCTIQYNAFLQHKLKTQLLKGGNTDEFYANEGTLLKSQMQVRMHPDVSRLMWKYGRVHHHVDYRPFQRNKLVLRDDFVVPQGPDNYGMKITKRDAPRRSGRPRKVTQNG
ncbi:MAG: hypothetical protein EOO38_01685 [Cytophagaceae bacterium]|nr:MAG: hypothetical protein EOO38_01685 [Cytophagaceae bacterium]